MFVCVALALGVVVSMSYAQDRPKMEGTRISGKVKAVSETSITVTVKKEEATEDVTLVVNADTKVFVGREAKAIGDVKADANVMVVYKKVGEGEKKVDTALMIRVTTGEGGKKRGG